MTQAAIGPHAWDYYSSFHETLNFLFITSIDIRTAWFI